MKSKIKNRIIGSIIVIIALTLIFYLITKNISKFTGNVVNNSNLEDFAKCLSSKNVKMFGAFWCGHCQNQKSMFGNGYLAAGEKLLKDNNIYVECDPRGENNQTQLCLDSGIEGYPTWHINGKLYPGEKSIQELSDLTGC